MLLDLESGTIFHANGDLEETVVQEVDDTPQAGMTLAECVKMLRETSGQSVRLRFAAPETDQLLKVTLTREILDAAS